MADDPLRLGTVELPLWGSGNGWLLVRAVDIDRVVVTRERDPGAVDALQREYARDDDYNYVGRGDTEYRRRLREVPLVDKGTVILKNGQAYEVRATKEELHGILRDS